MRKTRLAALLLLGALQPVTSFAINGVQEINQTCAALLGCFGGDTAGYPVTIDGSSGNSYRLTSDLVVPDENTNGISITTSSIDIDLNGFEIVRSGCEGAIVNCAPANGSGYGVAATSSGEEGVSVHNGTVTGMGDGGVLLFGRQSKAHGLRVRWNRNVGIHVGASSIVNNCNSYENGEFGIWARFASIVSDNTVRNNGTHGINAASDSTVIGNIARDNTLDGINAGSGTTLANNMVYLNGNIGILAGEGSTVTGNTARSNDDHGIIALAGSTISNNTARNNGANGIVAFDGSVVIGNTASSNVSSGIFALAGTLVQSNTVRGNGSVGLVLVATSAYLRNVISANATGDVLSGYNMGRNFCNTATCP